MHRKVSLQGTNFSTAKKTAPSFALRFGLLKIDTFKTPEGTIKVIEAVINEQMAYVITLSDIQGITEI